MFFNKIWAFNSLHIKALSTKAITKSTSELFFQPEVQQLLTNLTRLDINKVFKKQKYGQELNPPEYKFLTSEEVEKLRTKANAKALKKIQVPPIVPPRNDDKLEILSDDKEIIGHDISKYVFTDITYGISDANKIIVVREPDGILREANTFERHRMNFAYFSRPGSTYKHPEMFEEENLKSICNRKEYLFILDRACAQFEPEDQKFHDVLAITFNHIYENGAFEVLRSTRHFGSLVFFLVNNNIIDNLLLQNLHFNMIEDAVWLIKLYQLVHPESKTAAVVHTGGNDIDFIQAFVSLDSHNKDQLNTALQTYSDVSTRITN